MHKFLNGAAFNNIHSSIFYCFVLILTIEKMFSLKNMNELIFKTKRWSKYLCNVCVLTFLP